MVEANLRFLASGFVVRLNSKSPPPKLLWIGTSASSEESTLSYFCDWITRVNTQYTYTHSFTLMFLCSVQETCNNKHLERTDIVLLKMLNNKMGIWKKSIFHIFFDSLKERSENFRNQIATQLDIAHSLTSVLLVPIPIHRNDESKNLNDIVDDSHALCTTNILHAL